MLGEKCALLLAGDPKCCTHFPRAALITYFAIRLLSLIKVDILCDVKAEGYKITDAAEKHW
jgi:hypothetical protein